MERTQATREEGGKGEEKRGSWLLKGRVEEGEGWRRDGRLGKEVEADEEQGEESD